MRLDRFVSLATGLSRREARDLIRSGRVRVGGVVARDSSLRVGGEEVSLDGRALRAPVHVYLAMFKPAGYLSATLRERGSVLEILDHPSRRRLSIAGRLDRDVEGLLLLSDDGEFVHRVISPKRKVEKEYWVWFSGRLPEGAKELVGGGLSLEDGTICRPGRLEVLGEGLLSLALVEGFFHQVKRMCKALGVSPLRIRRVRIGPVTLEGLAEGAFRELTPREVEILKGEGER